METESMRKDLKVRLPVKYHVQLQTLKILKGKNMAACVMEALDMYFDEDEADANAPPGLSA